MTEAIANFGTLPLCTNQPQNLLKTLRNWLSLERMRRTLDLGRGLLMNHIRDFLLELGKGFAAFNRWQISPY